MYSIIGPVPHTLNDFWQMVWQTGCDTIVMVTNPVEAGIVRVNDKYMYRTINYLKSGNFQV